jgi:hypothetical protein
MHERIEVSISCGECVRRGTPDCADCLVTHVVGSEPDSLELGDVAARAAELLVAEGLVPRLRFVPMSNRDRPAPR